MSFFIRLFTVFLVKYHFGHTSSPLHISFAPFTLPLQRNLCVPKFSHFLTECIQSIFLATFCQYVFFIIPTHHKYNIRLYHINSILFFISVLNIYNVNMPFKCFEIIRDYSISNFDITVFKFHFGLFCILKFSWQCDFNICHAIIV